MYRFRSILGQIGIASFTVDIKSSQMFIEETLNGQHSLASAWASSVC